MKLINKAENSNISNITLKQDEKQLIINIGGNGDLYWSIHNKEKKIMTILS